MFLTALSAALLGALVAPALSTALTRITEFELPEITLPELSLEAIEKVRSFETKYPWVGMVENMYSAVRDEWKLGRGQKFDKFVANNDF